MSPVRKAPWLSPLLLGFIAFVALGLPDALLGLAWPFMRLEFDQPLAASGLLVMAGTLGAAASGLISATIRRWFALGHLLALSCLLTGLALLGYVWAPSFLWLIVAAIVVGLAAGCTDAITNGYVAQHYHDGILQWLHACFGLGVTLGPLIMTGVFAAEAEWRWGYGLHAGVQFALAGLFWFTANRWHSEPGKTESSANETEASLLTSLKSGPVWLGLLSFFVYCGLEFSVGLWAFSLLTDVRGFSVEAAGLMVSAYWALFTVGRLIMGVVLRWFRTPKLIAFGVGLAVPSTLLFILAENLWANALALILIGFAYAPLYPALVATTRQRVGLRHYHNCMSLQVTGSALGVVLLPAAIGFISAQTSLLALPWALLGLTTLLAVLLVFAHRSNNG